MRAAVIRHYGRPEVFELVEADIPTPSPTQLLVRMRASSVNPVDCAIRSGQLRLFFPRSMPSVLGIDYAGVVEAVGAEVEGFAVGDEVFGFTDIRTGGAYAEYAVVEASGAAIKPANVSWREAGVTAGSGLTAYQALVEILNVQPDERVFINGAGGGVGTFAVQIAKVLGGHVTAVGSTSKREMLEQIGADVVIDYTKEDPFAARRAYDAVVDCVGNIGLLASRRLLAPGGRHVAVASRPAIMLRAGLGKLLPAPAYKTMYVVPRSSDVLAQWLRDGKVRPVVDRSFALEQVGDAQAYVERGRSAGKVSISIGDA